MSKEIINDAPPIGTVFYTEGKANEMVAEERKKWLECIEKIKAEIDTLNCIVRTKECHLLINDILDIIDQAIKECDTDE